MAGSAAASGRISFIAATASRSALPRSRKPGSGRTARRLDSVAIVTAPASPDLAALHHRVPVTIAPEDFERWLEAAPTTPTTSCRCCAGRAEASSPGTRFPRASIASPMTTRNCCCRSRTRSGRRRSRSPRRRPQRARRRRRRRMTGRVRCFEALAVVVAECAIAHGARGPITPNVSCERAADSVAQQKDQWVPAFVRRATS